MLGQQLETPPGLHEHRDDRAGKYDAEGEKRDNLYLKVSEKRDFELWLDLFDEITTDWYVRDNLRRVVLGASAVLQRRVHWTYLHVQDFRGALDLLLHCLMRL